MKNFKFLPGLVFSVVILFACGCTRPVPPGKSLEILSPTDGALVPGRTSVVLWGTWWPPGFITYTGDFSGNTRYLVVPVFSIEGKVLVDGRKTYEVKEGNFHSMPLKLSPGKHTITFTSWFGSHSVTVRVPEKPDITFVKEDPKEAGRKRRLSEKAVSVVYDYFGRHGEKVIQANAAFGEKEILAVRYVREEDGKISVRFRLFPREGVMNGSVEKGKDVAGTELKWVSQTALDMPGELEYCGDHFLAMVPGDEGVIFWEINNGEAPARAVVDYDWLGKELVKRGISKLDSSPPNLKESLGSTAELLCLKEGDLVAFNVYYHWFLLDPFHRVLRESAHRPIATENGYLAFFDGKGIRPLVDELPGYVPPCGDVDRVISRTVNELYPPAHFCGVGFDDGLVTVFSPYSGSVRYRVFYREGR